jgi:hypothetical protein
LEVVHGIDEDVMAAAEEIDPLCAILVNCGSNGETEACNYESVMRETTRCAYWDATTRGMVG